MLYTRYVVGIGGFLAALSKVSGLRYPRHFFSKPQITTLNPLLKVRLNSGALRATSYPFAES